ncbi:MAG: hypothetical protein ABFD81_09670 [Syntrophaceae bacterium]
MGPLGVLSLASLAGSSFLGAWSQYEQGNTQADAYKIDASRLRGLAAQARLQGKIQGYRQKQYADKVLGAQTVAIAKSGGSMDDPTSQMLLNESIQNASLDEWLIKYGAMLEESNYNMQAIEAKRAAASSRSAGKLGAIGSILGGVANIGGAYMGMKR